MSKDKSCKQETWNIGVIKFFDRIKGFGYVASNNCHIPRKEYAQDFYVCDSSFSDTRAKFDRALVIFEGISVAKKVRRYNKNVAADRQLGATYYFDHEVMNLKGVAVNIFHDLSIPRVEWLPEVIARIKSQEDRTPESTLLLIKHFVEKYKKDLPEGYRYIFTKDFDSELRNLWQELFSSLSTEESITVLNVYPPSAIYFDKAIVHKWIDEIEDKFEPEIWSDLKYCADKLDEPLQSSLKAKIKNLVDTFVDQIIYSWAHNEPLSSNIARKNDLGDIVSSYQIYTDTDFSERVAKANHQRNIICFQSSLNDFEENPGRNWDKTFGLFNKLSNNAQAVSLFSSSVQNALEELISMGKISVSVELLQRIEDIFPELFAKYSNKLWIPIEDRLLNSLHNAIQAKSRHEFETVFEDSFKSFLTIFDDERKDSLRPLITKAIIDSGVIDIINYAVDSDMEWISKEEAIDRSHELLNSIKDDELILFIENKPYLLDEIKELIIVRLLAAYTGKSLEVNLDNSSQDWIDPISYNITLLRSFKNFITFDSPIIESSWALYVDSLIAKDVLRLYHGRVIKRLPEGILISLIENLSIEDSSRSWQPWYDKPSFKDNSLERIFSDPNLNLFSLIVEHIKALTITQDNIFKIVWLIELLGFNKPENMNYWESRQWEMDFKSKLQRLRSEITDPQLAVILWGVYFQTSASKASLTEIYGYLPPYLQIRILKRLMMAIADGKMTHTAQSLYEFLGGRDKPLCMPIEIVFSYLILREKNPNERFSDKQMLSLLACREDHPEWIGIRKFVDECYGRVQVDWPDSSSISYWHTPFYNGIMKKDSSDIQLIIPHKMVDDYGHSQQYNNKYYNSLSKIIMLNYNISEIRQETTAIGTVYYFPKSELKSVIGLCRQFNIYWQGSAFQFSVKENGDDYFCECRLSNELSQNEGIPFYWCENRPCFRNIIRFRTSSEWEQYTVLDFMRIFNIPVDYNNKINGNIKYGYYIFFNAYLKGFAKLYEHLKCRKCGKLLLPKDISNFATMSVTEFSCQNSVCSEKDTIIYLNHCFNRPKCTAIIDSRDSKKCPNDRYICPECGGCCSTKNEQNRLSNLHLTGGYIPQGLTMFIEHNLGHWEKNEFYCYACGNKMEFTKGKWRCPSCGSIYG